MFCAKEQVDIPESQLRYLEAWGWIHRTDEPHTVEGAPVDDARNGPSERAGPAPDPGAPPYA